VTTPEPGGRCDLPSQASIRTICAVEAATRARARRARPRLKPLSAAETLTPLSAENRGQYRGIWRGHPSSKAPSVRCPHVRLDAGRLVAKAADERMLRRAVGAAASEILRAVTNGNMIL